MKGYNNNDLITTISTTISPSSQKAYYNFIDAVKSPETQKKYSYYLLKYIKDHLKIDKENLSDLLLQDSKKIEEDLISYIKVLRGKDKVSYSTINTRLAALYLFFTMNDIVLNRKKINRYLGEHIKTIKDRAYTREEIKQIIDNSDLKFKVVVSLMASSGCRIGAIPSLKLSALKYIEKYQLYQVVFYENTKSEYFSFTTPEFSKYLREYLDFRKRSGERLTPYSPLIRNDFVMDDLLRAQNPKPLTLGALSVCLRQILIKSGLRIVIPRTEETNFSRKGNRKPIALNHAFRKFAHTTMANAKINIEIREMLLGHSIGLSDAYYRPTPEQCLLEYLNVIDELTINPENRLQKQVKELKEKDEYSKYIIEKKMKEMEEQNQLLTSQLNDITKQIQEIHYTNNTTRKKVDPETLHKLKTGTWEDKNEFVLENLLEVGDRKEKEKQALANIMIKQGVLTEEEWKKQQEEENNSKTGKRRRETDRRLREELNYLKSLKSKRKE